MTLRRTIAIVITAALAMLGMSLAASPANAAPAKQFPFCSWWLETTPTTSNVAFPDTSATYWTTPYIAKSGMSIRIDGEFPETRFTSFTVYNNTFGYFTNNGVESQLTDYQIAANSGSLNPWATNAAPNTPSGGKFSITLQPSVNTSETNVLPILPENPTANGALPANLGFLTMRVYLPAGGDANDVVLPNLTVINADGSTSALKRCTKPSLQKAQGTHYGVKAVKGLKKLQKGVPPAPCGDSCPPPYSFFRATAATTGGFFPNSANAYASMLFTPAKNQVVVIKLLPPTSPWNTDGTGTVPVPWPNNTDQLRYWSVCNNVYTAPYPVVANQTKNGVTYGCVADNAAVRASDGYVYIAISKPAFRPKNANSANSINWLPTSTKYPKAMEMVALRNMLSNDFANAVQSAPQNASASGAAAAMGSYYPTVTLCTKVQFEVGGPTACTAP